MRLLKEIIEGIRRECGSDFPISVRLSVEEFYDTIGYPGQGITLDEGVEMAKMLESFGIDASAAETTIRRKPPANPSAFLPDGASIWRKRSRIRSTSPSSPPT